MASTTNTIVRALVVASSLSFPPVTTKVKEYVFLLYRFFIAENMYAHICTYGKHTIQNSASYWDEYKFVD